MKQGREKPKSWNIAAEKAKGRETMMFDRWLRRATRSLVFSGERRAARAEFTDHFQLRMEDFLQRGLSWKEAQAKAVEVLGDPAEVDGLLAQVHRPILSWCLFIARILLALVLVQALLFGVLLFRSPELFPSGDLHALLYGDSPTVLARRSWSSSDSVTLGPYAVEIEDVAFFLTREEAPAPDGSAQAGGSAVCRLAISYTAAPWHRVNKTVVDRILRVSVEPGPADSGSAAPDADACGEQDAAFSQFTRRFRWNTWVTVVELETVPDEADRIVVCFEQAGKTCRLEIQLRDWRWEPEYASEAAGNGWSGMPTLEPGEEAAP